MKNKPNVLVMAHYKDMNLLEKEVQDIVRLKPPAAGYVVDLSDVAFILSSAISQVVKLFKYCRKAGVPFKVINARKNVETFETLKLTNLFEVSK